MQIFKNFLLACSIAVAISPVSLRAEDTEAQAAARAALQQKMRELSGQPPATEVYQTPPPNLQTPQAPATAPRSVLAPPPRQGAAAQPAFEPRPPRAPAAPMTPAIVPGHPSPILLAPEPASSDLIEQARQAMRAKMAELQGSSTEVPVETPAPQFQPVTTPMAGPAGSMTAPVSTSVKPAKPSKTAARESKSKKIEATPIFTPTPMEAPASSLPAGKEQRLQTLLEQYKADQITSEQYHEQRAKIIAEP